MPIRKRRAGWQVDVRVGGQRVRQTVGTKALAIELEKKHQEDSQRARHGLRPNRTLTEALAEHLTTSASALKSLDDIRYVAKVIRPFLKRPIERIADAASEIIKAGQAKGRAPATINRHLALLRRIGNMAFVWGWTDVQVGKRVQLLPEDNERHVYLTAEEVEKIAGHCKHQGARDAIWLAACTGLRRGELLALSPQNWRDGALWLATSKSGRPRRVPVPPQAVKICQNLPLKVTHDSLRDEWERARGLADLGHVRFHDLRHTYASWLVQGGADLLAVKHLLGHSTMQMTSRYAHLEEGQLNRAVKRLGKKKRGDHLVTTASTPWPSPCRCCTP